MQQGRELKWGINQFQQALYVFIFEYIQESSENTFRLGFRNAIVKVAQTFRMLMTSNPEGGLDDVVYLKITCNGKHLRNYFC